MTFDLDKAQEFALHVWRFKQGEVVSLMIHLGDRLGLYRAMAGSGAMTEAEVAASCRLDRRWTEEWLLGQVAAGILDRTDDQRFVLGDEAAAVLVDEESLLFAAGTFTAGTLPEVVDRVVEGFRTGIGFTYADLGEASVAQIDRQNGPWLRHFLVPVVVAQLAGTHERLRAGGTVIDVGCGGGVALQAFADAFPQAQLVGVDTSGPALDIARVRLSGRSHVRLHLGELEELDAAAPADLITTLDSMHDMTRPDLAAVAIKGRLAHDGVWLIKDIKCGPTFEANRRNPLLAMQYGFSVLSCLPSSMSAPDGLGLGTLGLCPERVHEIATAAGFTSVERLSADDPAHFYYAVRH
jgi:2-polyprenyl-3-methyl-5-hydroxy-6-metoxy-1,4-benzoquinol methylase